MEKIIKNIKLKKKINLLVTAIPFIPIIKRYENELRKRNITYTILESKQQVNEKKLPKVIPKSMQGIFNNIEQLHPHSMKNFTKLNQCIVQYYDS